ncbi:Rqc2 family fibronectin-binding protein [Rummeliibacillus pycnus]|uniref:Rqc2 family fibronectin-binding protein n=1 Tax=Rummeliibacillus pycnus TaxID=101070 RepID=UPI003D2D6A4B
MAYDGLFTLAMTKELQQLVTGRIAKVHQPNAQEIILTIRANGSNHKLLFSIHSSYARVHLTEQVVENPAEPPMFCMLLRKHIEGGFIESIHQIDSDRIIVLTITSKNEIGDPITRELHAEIMGRHSNLILVEKESQKIVDSLKHLPPALNSYRTVLPGQIYVAPPSQDKVNPIEVTNEELQTFFAIKKTAQEIVQHFTGFSSLHANEFLHRDEIRGIPTTELFHSFINEFTNGGSEPTYIEVNGKTQFSPIALTHLEGKSTTYPSLSALLDRVFFARAERDRVKQQAGDLERWLQNEISKLKLKLKKLQKDLNHASNLDQYQLFGELLMANLYNFEKGVKEVSVVNYYDENGAEVKIPLSERKTPIENAQSYYTKYNKAKNALIMVQKQIDKTNEDLAYFEMLSQQVQQASPHDIEEIREELAEQGFLKMRASKRRKKPTKPAPEAFISSTGTRISVGKNNKQNDYLTFKIARKSEIWMHTKDIPGSHVVIHDSNPDEQTIREAATLSAYFSKARESSSVPVDYTEIRQVKKPSGAKPGFVIYFEQKTIFVTPDEELVMKLKQD